MFNCYFESPGAGNLPGIFNETRWKRTKWILKRKRNYPSSAACRGCTVAMWDLKPKFQKRSALKLDGWTIPRKLRIVSPKPLLYPFFYFQVFIINILLLWLILIKCGRMLCWPCVSSIGESVTRYMWSRVTFRLFGYAPGCIATKVIRRPVARPEWWVHIK